MNNQIIVILKSIKGIEEPEIERIGREISVMIKSKEDKFTSFMRPLCVPWVLSVWTYSFIYKISLTFFDQLIICSVLGAFFTLRHLEKKANESGKNGDAK